jgi:hypothetical protein
MISDRACLAEFENQHWHPRREWSSVEDERIAELHLLMGADWAIMATQLEDHTGCELKNRWNSLPQKAKGEKDRRSGKATGYENTRAIALFLVASRRHVVLREADHD